MYSCLANRKWFGVRPLGRGYLLYSKGAIIYSIIAASKFCFPDPLQGVNPNCITGLIDAEVHSLLVSQKILD